jgi:hypothetical protein
LSRIVLLRKSNQTFGRFCTQALFQSREGPARTLTTPDLGLPRFSVAYTLGKALYRANAEAQCLHCHDQTIPPIAPVQPEPHASGRRTSVAFKLDPVFCAVLLFQDHLRRAIALAYDLSSSPAHIEPLSWRYSAVSSPQKTTGMAVSSMQKTYVRLPERLGSRAALSLSRSCFHE